MNKEVEHLNRVGRLQFSYPFAKAPKAPLILEPLCKKLYAS